MKKQVFGLIAALFVCAVLLPVGVRATDADAAGVYAILYEDGTLVFQNGNTPEPGRAVTNTYEVDLTAVYTYFRGTTTTPWYNERNSIRVVNFEDRISPSATAYWFYGCGNLERIDNIQNLDTANVTDMSWMFYDCHGLATLDLSHFNTANVTDMSVMFGSCSGLTTLNVSNLNTSNVTDMSEIFFDCGSLTVLDVAHWDTANVTNMSYMFVSCSELMTLDVSHWDTANVRNMSNMFSDCNGLIALDVAHFDTANVTDMSGMFSGCSRLTVLDMSHFNTANVRNMHGMFSRCNNLNTICASDHFTITSVTDSYYGFDMFSDCTSLVGGNGTAFDESHTDMEYARIDTLDAPGYFTDKSTVYAITAATPQNGMLSVTFSNPAAATVAVACFDTNGRFLSVNLQDAPANVGAVTVSVPTNAKSALVMLWNNARRPLCAAFPADV